MERNVRLREFQNVIHLKRKLGHVSHICFIKYFRCCGLCVIQFWTLRWTSCYFSFWYGRLFIEASLHARQILNLFQHTYFRITSTHFSIHPILSIYLWLCKPCPLSNCKIVDTKCRYEKYPERSLINVWLAQALYCVPNSNNNNHERARLTSVSTVSWKCLRPKIPRTSWGFPHLYSGTKLINARSLLFSNTNSPTPQILVRVGTKWPTLKISWLTRPAQSQNRFIMYLTLRLTRGKLWLSIIPSHVSLRTISAIFSSNRIQIMIVSPRLSACVHVFYPSCSAGCAVRTNFSISYMLIGPFADVKTLAGLSARLLMAITPCPMQLWNWFISPWGVLPS
jgi:hypothetical protein